MRFIYREVYFDKFGLWASMIARCAGPEKFFGLTELIYKSQQKTKPDSGKDDGKDEKEKKDDNVVDADFEEVKDDNKEKSA